MRILSVFIFLSSLVLVASGCGDSKGGNTFSGPTVKSFSGQVVQEGKPLNLPANHGILLKMFFEENPMQSIGIPLGQDGSFSIGEMAAGKYGASLVSPQQGKGPPPKYGIPGGVNIEMGKTDGYKIDVGPGWKGP